MPAIRDWSFNYGTSTMATTILCELPVVFENDLLVAICSADTGAQAWSLSGWKQLFSQTNTSNLAILFKIAGAAETDPTFTYSVAETANITLLSIKDVDVKTPWAEANYASYSESNQDGTVDVNNVTIGIGQSFTGTGGVLSSCQFYLKKSGTPTGNAVAKIYAHSGTFGTSSIPTGAALATSDNFDVSTLTTSFALTTFTFSNNTNWFTLVNGTNYVVTIEYTGTASNFIQVGYDGSSPGHGGNYSSLVTVTWTPLATRDVCFYVKFFTFAHANVAATRAAVPTMTTTRNDSLVLYSASISAVAAPGFIEGPVTGINAKDGSAHSDGCGWAMLRTAGTTSASIFYGSYSSGNGKLAVCAVNPPATGATIIPAYNPADASIYLDPIHGVTAYNGNTAFAATATTHFGTSLNGKTLGNGTAAALADYGINSYHSMGQNTGVTTAGTWSGCTLVLATGNKPNVAGKNVLCHTMPSVPARIQTTDLVTKNGVKGIAFGMYSTSNTDYRWWHVHGAGTSWGTNRVPIVINDGNTSGRIQNTGSLNNASIAGFGFAISGFLVAPVWAFGSLWVLDTTTICGGVAAAPVGINGILEVAGLGHERWSVLQQAQNQMLVLQPLQFGDGGTNSVYLDLNNTSIEFPKQYDENSKQVYYCSVDNVAGLTYYPGASDTIKHRNSLVSSSSRYFWKIHASASTSATYDFNGLVVIGAGIIELRSGVTFTGVTWSDYSTMNANGAILDECIISQIPNTNDSLTTNGSTLIKNSTLTVTGVAAGNRWCSVASPVIFEHNTFIGSASTGHAIRITSTGTYTFKGNVFNSFGADGTTSAAIYNDSGGAVTINVTEGGGTPTVRNGSGASTTVNNAVTLTVTVVNSSGVAIQNARVGIYKTSDNSEILNSLTNASGVVTTSFAYTADTGIYIRVRKTSTGSTRYFNNESVGTITAGGFSSTVTILADTIASA
jgi:hypothetical protein